MRRALTLAISLVLAYGAAFVGSLFTAGAINTWYGTLIKSELNPPNWVFGPVWSVLYTVMAVAAWRVWERRKFERAPQALAVYVIHLFVNAFWSVAFFGLHDSVLALGVIIVLLALVAYIALVFYRIDRAAGLLFVPYLAWVLFAAYLNLTIVLLN